MSFLLRAASEACAHDVSGPAQREAVRAIQEISCSERGRISILDKRETVCAKIALQIVRFEETSQRLADFGHPPDKFGECLALRRATAFHRFGVVEQDFACPLHLSRDEAESCVDGLAREIGNDAEPREECWSVEIQPCALQPFVQRLA